MWQYKENLVYPNENLKNSIEKESFYRSNGNNIKVKQILSETALCFDVPIYVLNSWIMYFNDAADVIFKFKTIFKQDQTNDVFNYNLKSFEQNITNLETILRDYQSIFEYYLLNTKRFSDQEILRVKKSPLKSVEPLKFIPVNLHLEQFLVETNHSQIFEDTSLSEKTCYDFTSVGAFTTIHTCKSNFSKSLEALMHNDKKFEFDDPNDSINKYKTIDNEIWLVFYSIKLLSDIGNQLIELKLHTFHRKSDKLLKEIDILKGRMEIIYRVLIDSFNLSLSKYAEFAHIEIKQQFYNVKEQMTFFRVKFKAFYIEFDNLVLNGEFNKLNDFLVEIMIVLVDFYNLVISKGICDKFGFVNQCATFCQAMTTLISTIDLKYNKNSYHTDLELKKMLEFHQKNGFLFQVESMLSCFSTEHTMIFEHHLALQNLHNVYIHLPTNYVTLVESSTNYIKFNVERDGFHIYMYTINDSKPIRVYPLLVNVGINEASVTSNLLGKNYLQIFVNSQAISKLISYYQKSKSDLKENQHKLENILYHLNTKKSLFEDSRPVELLHKVAETTRLMNGFRVTNCKSGKDRSGVGVSLEQCLLLLRNHNLENSMTQEVLDDFRRNGTRMDILKKNVGNAKYAFNKLRYFLLPQLYRPPIELCDDLDT
ncbi:unnamed protein product [Brachionus calyciflorus]|uniref:Uncharacterized protein n=1 Tax=Brachionus calyciflorus TaxID=104777 RepID=A0A813M1G5_9BILA|nr:unnamed protein product [Brachionus calyciflorus]